MRGSDGRTGSLLSYVDLDARVANEAPAAMSGEFATLYSGVGRLSIAPKRLLRAMLLQAFYGIRPEAADLRELVAV